MVSKLNDAADSFRGIEGPDEEEGREKEKEEEEGLKMAEADTGLLLDLGVGVASERVKVINPSSPPATSIGDAKLDAVVVLDGDNS